MAEAVLNPIPCEICDNPAAKFHCNTCGDALCETCKIRHLRSKGTRHHVIVPYAQKLNPKYLAGLSCHTHHGSAPEFWCDTCSVPICIPCITGKHRGHHFSDITRFLSEKRDGMVKEMKTLRDKTIIEWEDGLLHAQEITTDFLNKIEDIDRELAYRANEMHKHVYTILSNSRQTLREMKTAGISKLQAQENYISEGLSHLRENLTSYEDHLMEANASVLLQFQEMSTRGREWMLPSPFETASCPTFVQGQNDPEYLEQIFGKIVDPDEVNGSDAEMCTSITEIIEYPSDSEETMAAMTSQFSQKAVVRRRKSVVPAPIVESKFNVDIFYPCIACTQDGQAWVETHFNGLQLVDRNGAVKDTVKIDFNINDIDFMSDGSMILADYSYGNYCVKLLSQDRKINTLFKTDWSPSALCCLENDDIVVTFQHAGKIIMFANTGEIKSKFDDIKFRYPMAVAKNKITKDIYVCDHEVNFYYSTGNVKAIGTNGQLKYEYAGQGYEQFTPVEVCTDQVGHILITDYSNHRVHILDREGQFIQYLLTAEQGLHKPNTIDVDGEGYIWVGEDVTLGKGCVKVTKYLQDM